jgi:hypothetical protein
MQQQMAYQAQPPQPYNPGAYQQPPQLQHPAPQVVYVPVYVNGPPPPSEPQQPPPVLMAEEVQHVPEKPKDDRNCCIKVS